ncbi:hypothetical protein LP419_28575 [Massilia sp. H-1]|nr:hypothetical protein LP419_28575 [Massilia sp. H-1]
MGRCLARQRHGGVDVDDAVGCHRIGADVIHHVHARPGESPGRSCGQGRAPVGGAVKFPHAHLLRAAAGKPR